ncbi:hypothetical protein ACIBG7_39695 [Nonomuraea sp. NPDC050328]|uniref:hypothetical protein n=1 Tax=Nonomuraea sp. NPDC050328 TaxID=3364361 RepID=UPI003795544D
MTQKLAIPALVLVLLALFGVLVFEGRLRRMAHAAAVRKAGPQVRAEQAYPVGQGFAGGPQQAGYPGNTAYAPIISLVPVQTYPTVHMPYGPVYQDPYGQQAVFQQPQHHPGDPAAGYQQTAPYSYPQQPVHHEQPHFPEAEAHFPEEPPYVPPVEEERPREEYRDLFEPAVPASVEIPPGGDAPYREPHAPALGAEHGDPLPWEAAGDEGTVIYPLPGGVEDETVERRRPEPPAGEQRG